MDILKGFLSQIISLAGVVFIFGYVISLLRRAFCSVAGKSGPKILLVTGIIGTPIHELSHALMCVIFGHKIKSIRLFQPHSKDGTLGYVKHTYSKRNIYHQIGNFFIGIAPVLLGGGSILLMLLLFLPDTFHILRAELSYVCGAGIEVGALFDFLWSAILAIFSPYNFSSWQGWVFIIIALMIASHTEMSKADITGGLKGLVSLSVFLILVDTLLYFVYPAAFFAFVGIFTSFALLLSAFLSISVIFLLLMLVIALIFKLIAKIFGK